MNNHAGRNFACWREIGYKNFLGMALHTLSGTLWLFVGRELAYLHCSDNIEIICVYMHFIL